MTPPESTEPRAADATAELARYADKYRDTRIDEQFDLLLIYAKSLAAETQNTSLTNSEIEWLYQSVRNALLATIAPAEPGRVVIILDREEAYALRMGLTDLLTGPDGTHHQPCACLVCEMARELLDRIPPAAAERAATGGA